MNSIPIIRSWSVTLIVPVDDDAELGVVMGVPGGVRAGPAWPFPFPFPFPFDLPLVTATPLYLLAEHTRAAPDSTIQSLPAKVCRPKFAGQSLPAKVCRPKFAGQSLPAEVSRVAGVPQQRRPVRGADLRVISATLPR